MKMYNIEVLYNNNKNEITQLNKNFLILVFLSKTL